MLGESKYKVADLDTEGAEVRLATGGLGGTGNFKVSKTNVISVLTCYSFHRTKKSTRCRKGTLARKRSMS